MVWGDQKNQKYDVVIFDGLNIARKYEWVLRNMKHPRHGKVGLYHGILNAVLSVCHPTNVIIFTWDIGNSFRVCKSESYKSQRKSMPDEFWERIGTLQTMLSEMGIIHYWAEGYEADDIAYSIVNSLIRFHHRILLVTSDKDWYQSIINDDIVLQEGTGKQCRCIYRGDVEKIVGVPVEKYVLFKAIVGDRSDNIRGIMGTSKKSMARKVVIDIVNETNGTIESLSGRCSNQIDTYRSERTKLRNHLQSIEDNFEIIKLAKISGRSMNVSYSGGDETKLMSWLDRFELNNVKERYKAYKEKHNEVFKKIISQDNT